MTHYEKLGVSQTASQSEIKEAYKNLIKKYHPDVYQGDKAYAEKMAKEINVAYEILSDPQKKLEYDNEINPPKYTYTSSEYNYNYTPPKYDRPPTDYTSYRRYDNSRNYNYYDRYTNFNKNKTDNSNYYQTSPVEDKIINTISANKLIWGFLILIIYVVLLMFTLYQFYALKSNNYSGTILKPTQNKQEENIAPPNSSSEDYYEFPDSYKDFNINDYVSDSDLYKIYSEYFSSDYNNFNEFKEEFSKEFYDYYSQFY